MSAPAAAELTRLAQLWEAERLAAREEAREERLRLSLAERVERGIALRGLVLEDADAALGGRALLWFKPQPDVDLRELRIGVGEPVRLWAKQADGPDQHAGVIARVERTRLGVAVEAEYPEFLEAAGVNLDREAPEITFDRGSAALRRLRDAAGGSRAAEWREFLFGEARPEMRRAPEPEPAVLDPGLNDSQREAVRFALGAPRLALIHGPPGTGKTRTLVEIVRQCLRRSERLLLTAASNTALDNLAERLLAAGVPLLRLGHPARVASSVASSTLDARLEASPARRLSRRLMADATELRRRVDKRRARGNLPGHEARELYAQARQLASEARAQLELARESIFLEAKLVCTTAAGADPALLARLTFDRVILDEATQAADPIALIPLQLAPRAVLAGDPCQLSPTLRSPEAQALSHTLF
ncbi:MAG TPA: AAA domain-containing protein, partial [Polyangiales bacterium]|nr:AAA domain-containing protein [Polyangiales bacterium]